jgi:hypothetical protein
MTCQTTAPPTGRTRAAPGVSITMVRSRSGNCAVCFPRCGRRARARARRRRAGAGNAGGIQQACRCRGHTLWQAGEGVRRGDQLMLGAGHGSRVREARLSQAVAAFGPIVARRHAVSQLSAACRCARRCLEYAEQSEHLHSERKRLARFVRVEPAPKEQPPRKLSGKRTALRFNTLESGARCSRRRCKSKAGSSVSTKLSGR